MPLQIPECRAAIRAGDFAVADRLLAELRSEVEAAWPGASPQQRKDISREVMELLAWARQTVLAKRSHLRRRLLQTNRNRAYLPSHAAGAGCFDFEG